MGDYRHLKGLEVTSERTVDYTFHQISVNGKSPVLQVAPATEANKPYFNALLKRAGKTAKAVRAGGINARMMEENREQDREFYPRHVIKGWRDMLDVNGEEIEYSSSECSEFLHALPGWLFDDLRTFCGDPSNFTEVVDVEVVAKNSKSGSSGS